MGLDSVEIVLRIEDEFSISLPDDELSSVRTVGELYELVLSKLDTTPACLSSKAFYRTRQALVECLGLPRQSIRPSTPLDSLLPRTSLVQKWQEIADRTGLALPPLRRPRRWTETILGSRGKSDSNIQTAGDLAKIVLTMNFDEFESSPGELEPPSKENVWKRIVDVICDQMALESDEVVPEARIVEDLGVS
jgi:acyl carrier protein